MRQSLLILANIPLALVGGMLLLWVSGEYLSVPASVGFIALLGIAVLNHPDNSGGEPRWHVRAYGLMGTNPLATGSFTGEEMKAVTLQNGQSLHYRYRVYIHRGDARNDLCVE